MVCAWRMSGCVHGVHARVRARRACQGAARTSHSISGRGGPPSHRPSSSHSPPAALSATRRSCSAPACAAIARSDRSSARRRAPMPRREWGEPRGDSLSAGGDSSDGPGGSGASPASRSAAALAAVISPLTPSPLIPSRLWFVEAEILRIDKPRAVSSARRRVARAARITFSLKICDAVPPLMSCHFSRTCATMRDALSSSFSADSRQPICARHSRNSASVSKPSQPSTGLPFDFRWLVGASGRPDSNRCSSASASGVYHSAWALSLWSGVLWSTCRSMTSRRPRDSSCGRVEGWLAA
jgi:hypothetical protein